MQAKPGLTASLSLYGLGGVGKTQIAIEYAYLHKADYDIIYWFQANDWVTLLGNFVELSRDQKLAAFGAPSFKDGDDNFLIAFGLKRWFEEETKLKWLLIFDNVEIGGLEDPHSVADLIPKGESGKGLITSRNRASDGEVASAGNEIVEMTENEAIELLSKSSRIKESHDDQWSRLVRLLGCLPLAIEQAASFIRTSGMSIQKYISLYEANQPKLLNETLPKSLRVYYQHTVATTWKVSFAQLEELDPLACEMLRLTIFLDGTNIQKDVFEGAGEVLDGAWSLSTASDLRLEQAFQHILEFSLIRPLIDEAFAVHRLVQEIMLIDIGDKAQHHLLATIVLVERRFPWGGEPSNLRTCLRYSTQAHSCIRHGVKFEIVSDEMIRLLGSVAAFFDVNGQYDDAITQYKQALLIKEKAFGVDHINAANTINNLDTYDSQGKYDEAIAQYERALRIYEKAFGVDHINAAHTIMNIGLLYQSCSQAHLARTWLQRGHAILLHNLGAWHPDTVKANSIVHGSITKSIFGQKRTQSTWKSEFKRFFGRKQNPPRP